MNFVAGWGPGWHAKSCSRSAVNGARNVRLSLTPSPGQWNPSLPIRLLQNVVITNANGLIAYWKNSTQTTLGGRLDPFYLPTLVFWMQSVLSPTLSWQGPGQDKNCINQRTLPALVFPFSLPFVLIVLELSAPPCGCRMLQCVVRVIEQRSALCCFMFI